MVVAGRGSPSTALQLNAEMNDLVAEAATMRRLAVTDARRVPWNPDVVACDGGEATTTFYPDGTADALSICLEKDEQRVELRVDPLTALLIEVSQ